MIGLIKNIFIILLFVFSIGKIFAADMGPIVQDISKYEEVDFVPPVITTGAFPKPHCGGCEDKVILNVRFSHEKDFKRIINSELDQTYFPYHLKREKLFNKEFRTAKPSALSSKINKIISNSKSAIVLYDGNGAGQYGRYPAGGVYLPEKGKCRSLRKYLKKLRREYREYKTRSANDSYKAQNKTRQKYFKKYTKSYSDYKKYLCNQRVLQYKPSFLDSLSGPDLVFFESSGVLSGRKPNSSEYGVHDSFTGGNSIILREEPALIGGKYDPERDIKVIVGSSDHFTRLKQVKSAKDSLDVDYNCQVTLHEAWSVLRPQEATGGLQGDLKPIYNWSGQRAAIKSNSVDFASNPGGYSEQYKSTQNAVGFTTVVNLSKCKNIPFPMDSVLKLALDNSPSSRMNEGLLARVPKFFKGNELNIELSTEWDYFNAKLAENLFDKARYKLKGIRGWRDGVLQGVVGNITSDSLEMGELARKAMSDPAKAKELIVKVGKAGVKKVKEYFVDEDGNVLPLNEINKKLATSSKEMVMAGGKLVVKDCVKDYCRGVSKLAMEVGFGIATGGLGAKATAKVGKSFFKKADSLISEIGLPNGPKTSEILSSFQDTAGGAGKKGEYSNLQAIDYQKVKPDTPIPNVKPKQAGKYEGLKPGQSGYVANLSEDVHRFQQMGRSDLAKKLLEQQGIKTDVATFLKNPVNVIDDVAKTKIVGSSKEFDGADDDGMKALREAGFFDEIPSKPKSRIGPELDKVERLLSDSSDVVVMEASNGQFVQRSVMSGDFASSHDNTAKSFTAMISDDGKLYLGKNIPALNPVHNIGGPGSHKVMAKQMGMREVGYKGGAIRFHPDGTIDISGYHFAVSDIDSATKMREIIQKQYPDATIRITEDRLSTLPPLQAEDVLSGIAPRTVQGRSVTQALSKPNIIMDVKGEDAFNGVGFKIVDPKSGKVLEESFAFGDKGGRHVKLMDEVEKKYGKDRVKFTWLGEAKVEKGKITKMNEMAGEMQEKVKLSGYSYKIEGVDAAKRLSKDPKNSHLFGKKPEFDKFVEGGENPHVMDGMDAVKFFRHDSTNKAVSINGLAQMAERKGSNAILIKRSEIIRKSASEMDKEFGIYRRNFDTGLSKSEADEFSSLLQGVKKNPEQLNTKMGKRIEELNNKISDHGNKSRMEIFSGAEKDMTYSADLHQTNNMGKVSEAQKKAGLCRGDNCAYTAYADALNRKAGKHVASAMPAPKGGVSINVNPAHRVDDISAVTRKGGQSGSVSVHALDPKTGKSIGHIFSFEKGKGGKPGKFKDSQSGEMFGEIEFRKKYGNAKEIYFSPDSSIVKSGVVPQEVRQVAGSDSSVASSTKKVAGDITNITKSTRKVEPVGAKESTKHSTYHGTQDSPVRDKVILTGEISERLPASTYGPDGKILQAGATSKTAKGAGEKVKDFIKSKTEKVKKLLGGGKKSKGELEYTKEEIEGSWLNANKQTADVPLFKRPGYVRSGDFENNCTNCVVATYHARSGRPASALPLTSKKMQNIGHLQEYFGTSFSKEYWRKGFKEQILSNKVGTKGVLYYKYNVKEPTGHVVNFEIHSDGAGGSKVVIFEGQTGDKKSLGKIEEDNLILSGRVLIIDDEKVGRNITNFNN